MTEKTVKPEIRFAGFTDAWEQRKVSDAANRFDNLRVPVAANLRVSGTTPYYGANGIQDYVDGFTHEGEFVLVAEDGANDLKNYPVKCVNGRIWVNNHAHVLQAKPKIADNKYLAYSLSQVDIESLLVGGGRAKLNAEIMMEIEIYIPTLNEQAAIGRYFTTLDNLITLHQRKYDKLTKVKKSMLEKMFPKNGATVPEIRFKGFSDAWEQRKVSDAANRFDNLRVPVAANLRVSGTTPYYGANGIQDYVDGFTHEGEFVLVAEDGANDLKNYPVKCVNGRIWVNNHAHVLQAKPKIADNKYLAYSLSQVDIESLLVGGGRAKLNAEIMMEIEIYIPTLNEQAAIGRYFTTLDNLITLHQRKYDKLTKVKKSMLEKMFPKNGATVPEIRFKGFSDAWEQRKLGEVCNSFEYGLNAAAKEFDGINKYIRITDIDDDSRVFLDSDLTSPDCDLSSTEKYKLQDGDIVFARTGASVGKTFIYKVSDGLVYYAGFLIRAKINANSYPDFVFYNTLTKEYEKFIRITSQRSGQPGVNAQEYSSFEFSLPSYEEQKRIGRFFRNLDHLITLHQRELEKLKNIKKACLEKMFV